MTISRAGYTLASALVVSVMLVLTACQAEQAPASPTAPATKAAATTAAAPAGTTAATQAATSAAPAPAVTTATSAATAAAAPATTIKLGILTSITGPIARNGITIDRAMRMSIDDINAKGGFKVGDKTYKFEAVTADDTYTSEGGRAAADRLVLGEKIKFIGGTAISPTAGAQAVTDPNNVLYLPCCVADVSLGKAHPLTLAIGTPNNWMRVPALYDWLKKTQPQAKNIALILSNDVNGKAYQEVAEQSVKDRGLNILDTETFGMDIKDFSPLVAKLLRVQNIDAIDVGTIGASAPIFTALMKALYEQGWRKPVLGHGLSVSALKGLDVMGENYIVSAMADWKSSIIPQGERQVLDAYVKKYSEAELEPQSLNMYNTPLVLSQAMTKAGTVEDTTKLADTLRSGTWDSIFGPAKFVGAKRFGLPSVLQAPIYISTSKAGNMVTFDRAMGTID